MRKAAVAFALVLASGAAPAQLSPRDEADLRRAEDLRRQALEVEQRGLRVSLIEPGTVGTDMQESSAEEQREKIARHEMLLAEDIAETIGFVLSRPPRVDVVTLRVEPRVQELP